MEGINKRKLFYGFSRGKKRWAERNFARYKLIVTNDEEKFVYYENIISEVKKIKNYFKKKDYSVRLFKL